MKLYFVYAIANEDESRIYVGLTDNVQRRVKEHNSGKQRSTKPYRPWRLFYNEEYNTRIKARGREIYLKSI